MELSTEAYAAMAGIVKEIADACCEGRLVAALEGGYNLNTLSESIVSVLRAFKGEKVDISRGDDARVAERIEEVKNAQKAYWECLQ